MQRDFCDFEHDPHSCVDEGTTWYTKDQLRLTSQLQPQFIIFMSASTREREDDDNEARSSKRTKTTSSEFHDDHVASKSLQADLGSNEAQESILPPSHVLLGLSSPQTTSGGLRQLLECDVGISEYITRNLPPIRGIIKQRWVTLRAVGAILRLLQIYGLFGQRS